MHGFHGRLLHIDLTRRTSSRRDLDPARLRAYLGGIGLGASLLYEWAPPGVEPFAPENPLIFASAPLVGTGLTTTAKFAVVTKSPLTGFIADSLSSSRFALELKRVGVDAVVITGRASSLVNVFIRDDQVEFHDAGRMRGQSPGATETLVREQLNAADARVAAIGVAGENRVRFATISNEGRHAGRGGVGAVMGAKNLKAIALRGGGEISVADGPGVEAIAESLRRRSLGPLTDKYRNIGTVANLSVFNRLGTLPTRNFRQSTFEAADAVSGEVLTESHFNRRHGCASCTILCERLFKATGGEEQRLEYETLFALGPLCGVEDPDAVLGAARLCDEYGLDTISVGGTLAWAMECAEKGILPEDGRVALRFGDASAVASALDAIARREGVGSLLAEGSRRAAADAAAAVPLGLLAAIAIVDQRFAEPLSLAIVARHVGVHPVHLARTFRRVYRTTFASYVRQLRIDFAQRQLAGSAALSEIAYAAGFCDQSHFARCFKRHTGLTPAAYRARCR